MMSCFSRSSSMVPGSIGLAIRILIGLFSYSLPFKAE
jgi:hypothetical protein